MHIRMAKNWWEDEELYERYLEEREELTRKFRDEFAARKVQLQDEAIADISSDF
jgi:hypothetical protein